VCFARRERERDVRIQISRCPRNRREKKRTDPFDLDLDDAESLPSLTTPPSFFLSFSFHPPPHFSQLSQQVKHDENEHRTGVARAGRDSDALTWNDFLTL